MRKVVTILVLMIGFNLYAQTDSIENSLLYKKALSGEISGQDYSWTIKKWKETIKKIGEYPNLPIGLDGKIQYSFVRNFPTVDKGLLYNRILEWFSIAYGIVPAYLYSSREDGKIICSNNFKVNDNVTCTFTYVITIKDYKILMYLTNLGYQESHAGYYSGDTWVPDRSDYFVLDQVFPIILKDSSKWNYYLGMLISINKQMNNEIESLSDYLINYDSHYNF